VDCPAVIHIAFLLSALAIAYSDRIMTQHTPNRRLLTLLGRPLAPPATTPRTNQTGIRHVAANLHHQTGDFIAALPVMPFSTSATANSR
jgi:hypothetical protein